MNERKLTKSELKKREDIIMNMKGNKRDLVKKYGKDAESVMYGRATNMAKKQSEGMNSDKLREMIKDSLKNPKAADLNKDGKLSDYEEKRGAAIEKNLDESSSSEEKRMAQMAIKKFAKYRGVSEEEARQDLIRAAKELGDLSEGVEDVIDPAEYGDIGDAYLKGFDKPHSLDLDQLEKLGRKIVKQLYKGDFKAAKAKFLSEDLDLGHQDNEPHMLKADLYRIGKYAMDLYKMMDSFEGEGEVDLPHWWQSKISNAKSAIVGAKHYLDFEIKEPAIDAVVNRMDDIAPEMEVDVVDDIEIEEDLFTPNEIGDEAIDHESASGAFEGVAKKLAKIIKENDILKEFTDNDFSGNALIAQTTSPERDELVVYDDFFPEGVASRSNAIASLQAHDESPIKARMGRYAPMFVHVQYHEFEDEMAGKYRVHQTQYYNSNFKDKDPNFNPGVSKLSLIKLDPSGDRDKEVDMGSILVKTDDYIRDLKNLNITKRQS